MCSNFEYFFQFCDYIFLKQIISTEYKVIFVHCQSTHRVTSCIMPKKQCIVIYTPDFI